MLFKHRIFCKWIKFTFLAIIYFAFIFSYIGADLDFFDEPIQLLSGKLVANNWVPHLHFWSLYPSLNYYLIAIAYKLYGETYLAVRVLNCAIFLFVSLYIIFNIKNNIIFFSKIIIVFILGLLLYLPYCTPFYLMIFGAIYYCECKKNYQFFILGLILAIVALMRINFGLYLLAAVGVNELLRKPFRLRIIFYISIGFIIISSLFFAISKTPFRAFLDETFIFPLKNMQINRIRSPQWHDLILLFYPLILVLKFTSKRILLFSLVLLFLLGIYYLNIYYSHLLPIASIGMVAIWVFFGRCMQKKIPERTLFLIVLASFCIHYYLSRADTFHIYPFIGICTLCCALNISFNDKFYLNVLKILFYTYLSFYLFQNSPNFYKNIKLIIQNGKIIKEQFIYGDINVIRNYLNKSSNLYFIKDGDEINTIKYLNNNMGPIDPIYIGSFDHSNTYIANTRLYYFLDHIPGIYYYMPEPGLTTTCEKQILIIENLRSNKIKWITLFEGSTFADKDFLSRNRSGCRELDFYISENYTQVKSYGKYHIYQSK